MVIDNILKNKTVSVWGLGYLGYTMMLKLQSSGFNIVVYDLNSSQLKEFASGNYPDKERIASWSRMGYLPRLDLDRIKVAKDPRELFRSSSLHIIAIPEKKLAQRLPEIFAQNLKYSSLAPLIIFETAFVPGYIERYFVKELCKYKIEASKDYFLSALFRSDWGIESFIERKNKMFCAGFCSKSLQAVRGLAQYMEIPLVALNSIKEAEVYINASNVIQAMVNDFMRQLAIGYPCVNMKELSGVLFKNISLDDCVLNIGTGGTRMTFAIDYLMEGSESPQKLTLLREFQDINISSVLNYAEYIIRKGYKSVSILGITYKGNQKDLTLSPAVTLADYLLKNSVKVSLHDPFCSATEIKKLVKGAVVSQYPADVFSAEVLVIASDHNLYKYMTQRDFEAIKKNTRIIIDNYGIWSHLSFGNKIKYHQIGDGRLDLSK